MVKAVSNEEVQEVMWAVFNFGLVNREVTSWWGAVALWVHYWSCTSFGMYVVKKGMIQVVPCLAPT
jgi:hypothetical protein